MVRPCLTLLNNVVFMLVLPVRYLFVCKDEQQGVSQLLLRQQFGQLAVSLHESVPVAAVDHKHHRCAHRSHKRRELL